jgi:AraC family transcriptional regulator
MTSQLYRDFSGSNLMSREVDGFVLRETVHQAGGKIAKHSHERAHLAFVLRGVVEEKCESKTLVCQPLSASFLAPGMSHSDDFGNGVHCLLVVIEPQRLERVREALPLDEPIFSRSGMLAWLAVRLYDQARQSDTASSLALEGLMMEILAEVSRQGSAISHVKIPGWLGQAREFLHEHFTESLTHDYIASLVSVHPVHLAKVFRQHYKCTIGEYVRRLRIEHATYAISTSDISLVEVALICGFSDQSHFSKVFKQTVGMTPTEFRVNLSRPMILT